MIMLCRRDLRADVALKYAKAELMGESQLSAPASQPASKRSRTEGGMVVRQVIPTVLEEIVSSQIKGHLPIIVIPPISSSRSRITALNALRFLRDGVYEEPNSRSMERPAMPMEIERTICGRLLKFRVFDDTSRFKRDEWKATVAIFCDGKRWQLSGWPFKSEADLFYSVTAFNLRYLDDPVDPNIAQWKVKPLLVKRTARHTDSSVMNEFWKNLEIFLNSPKNRKFTAQHKLA
jgi:hypothetical protein